MWRWLGLTCSKFYHKSNQSQNRLLQSRASGNLSTTQVLEAFIKTSTIMRSSMIFASYTLTPRLNAWRICLSSNRQTEYFLRIHSTSFMLPCANYGRRILSTRPGTTNSLSIGRRPLKFSTSASPKPGPTLKLTMRWWSKVNDLDLTNEDSNYDRKVVFN